MIACYIMLFIIIIQLIIIYNRFNAFKKDYFHTINSINKKLIYIEDKINSIKPNTDYIFNKIDSINDVINYHIKDSINHIIYNTNSTNEEIKHIIKYNKKNEAKFSFMLKILRLLSSRNNNSTTKLKTAKTNEK